MLDIDTCINGVEINKIDLDSDEKTTENSI